MNVQIPCGCGQHVAADSSQAGLAVRCPCGREVEVPAWRRPPGGDDRERAGSRPSRLTELGWVFVILAVVVVLVTGAAAGSVCEFIGLQGTRDAKNFRVIMSGGALVLVCAAGAVLRVVFGVRFYRE
ncbi:hypothetical protein J8F10_23205 [Gemmata sp. G18]|uniref:Uncharacterized protein n=1 Tax=Gemmata palustris TaxID=2822762 RepID=A0ABS5BZ43_9BACT|nr:hypothetical protein [Gemmata palustris]MBP3958168.1 hypothetical protein [Gemmata palustris]